MLLFDQHNLSSFDNNSLIPLSEHMWKEPSVVVLYITMNSVRKRVSFKSMGD